MKSHKFKMILDKFIISIKLYEKKIEAKNGMIGKFIIFAMLS